MHLDIGIGVCLFGMQIFRVDFSNKGPNKPLLTHEQGFEPNKIMHDFLMCFLAFDTLLSCLLSCFLACFFSRLLSRFLLRFLLCFFFGASHLSTPQWPPWRSGGDLPRELLVHVVHEVPGQARPARLVAEPRGRGV